MCIRDRWKRSHVVVPSFRRPGESQSGDSPSHRVRAVSYTHLFFAHDAQIVASGITTVFDALSVGEYHDKGRIAMLGKAVGALNSCRSTGKLRSEHLLHLRCEVADPRMQDLFFPLSDTPCLLYTSRVDFFTLVRGED